MEKSVVVGIIQDSPVYLDLEKSMEKADVLVERAASKGADLIVFGETWLSGYPAWLDSCDEVNYWDHEPVKEIFSRTFDNSIEVPGKETAQLCKLAKDLKLTIVICVNEKMSTGKGNGSLYNTLLTISREGKIANHHRKLVPTYTEKMVWAPGDGHGLNSVETDFGRVGGLICWEHWMPQTRQAMHECGEHIHVAVWPWVHDVHQLASQHYAFEGRCYVIAVGQILKAGSLPVECKLKEDLSGNPDLNLLRGGSCIFSPDGTPLLEPQLDLDDTIIFEIPDLGKTVRERMNLDVTGHYNRPDVFNLDINKDRR